MFSQNLIIFALLLANFAFTFANGKTLNKRNAVDSSDPFSDEIQANPRSFHDTAKFQNDPNSQAGASAVKSKSQTPDMMDEFKSDLKEIQNFAKGTRPIVSSMRRSLTSPTALSSHMKVVLRIIQTALLKVIDAIESQLPLIKPITKFVRMFVIKVFD